MDFLLSQNNIFILAVAIVSGLMLAWPAVTRGRSGSGVGTSQAIQMMNQNHAILVDVRTPELFQAGHIPQSRNVPLDEIEKKASALPKNKPLVVVCAQNRDAAKATARLRAQGFSEVVVLEGGVNAWTQAGLPLTAKKA